MTDKEKQAFESLSKDRNMKIIIEFYEKLVSKLCDVRYIKTEDIGSAKISGYFLQTELIDRLKGYDKPVGESSDSDYV